MEFLKERAKEKSTWAVVATALFGTAGIILTPDQATAIGAGMVTILGAVGVFTKEAK